MRKTLLRLLEAIVLRSVPGLINLGTLFLMGGWLAAADYGIYSTALATSTFIASMAFGPLTFAVVSQHAKLAAQGQALAYEGALTSAMLLIGATIAVLGTLAASAGILRWAAVAPVVAIGICTSAQEILHARLRLWAFGAVALTQAVIFLVLAWQFVRPDPSVDAALTAFAVSYGIAAVVSLAFSGMRALRWPDRRLLASTLAVGGPYTLSTAIEQGLYLGIRYLLYFLSTAHHLGVFSFCVDVAQRVIGFLINAVGFVIVPAAFLADAGKPGREFKRQLLRGGALALGLSMVAFVVLLALRSSGMVPALMSTAFDPWVFAVVSAAMMINRIKKLVFDPLAMRASRSIAIAMGYAISTPIALAVGAWALSRNVQHLAEIAYLFGYALAAIVTLFLIKPLLQQEQPS